MTRVAIIDYGSGNLRSASKAFERAARQAGGGIKIEVTREPQLVARADRVVLPGVGAFADCRAGIEAVPGMLEAIVDAVEVRGRPFLGICVGMQLMANQGHEHGVTPGFGWIAGAVEQIVPDDPALKVPHMGWNTLELMRDHPLFAGLERAAQGLHAYFVHSYQLVVERQEHLLARTWHGGPVTAVVGRDNMIGTQFHPEKSQALGLKLIENFLDWTP
ncbi:MAG: imidazole glycerol phosphate synthase subunit HisH [Rhizobiales bacterium]|nr:imidazole glycerol phosphate synthase subunit HisH [Hyphomicrobiales bacterium]